MTASLLSLPVLADNPKAPSKLDWLFAALKEMDEAIAAASQRKVGDRVVAVEQPVLADIKSIIRRVRGDARRAAAAEDVLVQ